MVLKRVALAVVLTALVPLLAACGSSSKNAAQPLPAAPPPLTVPGSTKVPKVNNAATQTTTTDTTTTTSTATTTTPTQTSTVQTNPSTPQGGAAPPTTGGAAPSGGTTTTSPSPTTPAGKFEQFCQENPGAC